MSSPTIYQIFSRQDLILETHWSHTGCIFEVGLRYLIDKTKRLSTDLTRVKIVWIPKLYLSLLIVGNG